MTGAANRVAADRAALASTDRRSTRPTPDRNPPATLARAQPHTDPAPGGRALAAPGPTPTRGGASARGSSGTRAPLDPRLLRHARSSRPGIALLALVGGGQAVSAVAAAVALTFIVAGPRGGAVGLLVGAYAARAVLAWAEQVVARRTAARVTDELRRRILDSLPRRGPAWAAAFGPGRLTAVLTGGLDALRPWFVGYLPALILGVTLPPLVITAIALVDPASALIALATLGLIPVLGALIGWATEARARQRWAADARLAGHFLDVVHGLPTLRMYGRAERQATVVAELADRHRSATLRVLRVAFLSSTALDLVGTLSVGLIAVEVGLRVAAGHLGLGPALLVILLAPEAYRPLRELAARYHAATGATAVIADVNEILRTDGHPRPPSFTTLRAHTTQDPPGFRKQGIDRAPGVVATGLHARYPGAAGNALDLPAITVSAGELVALRGPSGAGKTTALRVLAGLHPAVEGSFSVADPLYLPQRPTLPHARIVADLFEPGTSTDQTAAALAKVGLDAELTSGTPLGEHGAGVSAGQRQRLALAALLQRAAASPVTLLLDEPTAHLDPATERLVIAGLREAADTGAAVLVVAHRPALLAAADRTVDLTPPLLPDPTTPGPDREFGQTETVRPDPAPSTAGDVSEMSAPTPRPRRGPTVAVALGAGSSLAGVLLTGAAAWLLLRAATLPPVLTLSTAVVLVRGSAVARPLLRYLERLVSHDVALARLGARRSRVYAALVARVPGPRPRRRGDLLSRVIDDVDARVDGLLRGRLPMLATATTLAIAVTALGWMAPAVAVPLTVGIAVAGLIAPALAARQAVRADAGTATARTRLRDAMVEAVAGIEELTRGSDVPERRSRVLARLESRAAHAAGRAAALAHLGWGVAVAGTAVLLGRPTDASPQWTAVVLLAVVALGEPVLALPDAAVARYRAAGAAARLAGLTTQPPAANFPPGAPAHDAGQQPDLPRIGPLTRRGLDARWPDPPRIGSLTVRGLDAGWDDRTPPVLRGLDLELPAGARVAVTGRSGSGKSTLGAVLARLLDPRTGSIITGSGRDLLTLPERIVRRRIVLVGEDTGHVFASTVRENLRLARPAATDSELRTVLARVGLTGWFAALPDGLDTWLGTGGSTMSGGQVRRFTTARALLADPEVLILDEPTEGLDTETAEALMADLLDAASGRTVLLLTHRTEGLDRVDRTLALSGGRLTDSLSPDSATHT